MTAKQSTIGPCLIATLVSDRIDACLQAWAELDHGVHCEQTLSATTAKRWGVPQAEGARVLWLANGLGEPWLRLIEDPGAAPVPAFSTAGWQALEIAVLDVDALHGRLYNSQHFQVIGPPADLDVSDAIRAMQVRGPAGEILYLTQVKGPVPGFDLPQARCAVDRLFIPVLLSPNRDQAADCFTAIGAGAAQRFNTRVSVINRARGLPLHSRHPVATVQLAGNHLIEIDQLEGLQARAPGNSGLPAGVALISLAAATCASAGQGQGQGQENINICTGSGTAAQTSGARLLGSGPVTGLEAGSTASVSPSGAGDNHTRIAQLLRGPTGELFELISD